MKYTLYLSDRDNPVEVDGDKILANDVYMPWEWGNVKLWAIGDETGLLACVWAGCESDAIDEMIDNGLGLNFLVNEEDMDDYKVEQEDCAICGCEKNNEKPHDWGELSEHVYFDYPDLWHVGNAGEYADMNNMWMSTVQLKGERDYKLLCALSYAQGSSEDTLT